MKASIPLLLSTLAAANVSAQEHATSNYFELTAQQASINFDDFSLQADGYSLLYSVDITRGFSLLASYQDLDFDTLSYLDTGRSQASYGFGLGYQRALTPHMGVYGSLRWAAQDSKFNSSSQTGYGMTGDAGLRFWLMDDIEFDTGLRFSDISDPIAQTTRSMSIAGSVRWHFADRFSVAIGGESGEYDSSWTGSIRYDFGNGR